MKHKDPKLAALLGFLFGGFGLFYISAAQGVVALLILIVVGGITAGALAPIVWLGCGVWGYHAAQNFNAQQGALFDEDASRLAWESGSGFSQQHSPSPEVATSTSPAPPRAAPPSAASVGGGSFCTQCGSKNRAGARFCGNCGESVI